MIGKTPKVFKTKIATNQYLWLFFIAAHNPKPFQMASQRTNIAKIAGNKGLFVKGGNKLNISKRIVSLF